MIKTLGGHSSGNWLRNENICEINRTSIYAALTGPKLSRQNSFNYRDKRTDIVGDPYPDHLLLADEAVLVDVVEVEAPEDLLLDGPLGEH